MNKIDTTDWIEYLGDDCGAPPMDIPIEEMVITTAFSVRKRMRKVLPAAWSLEPGSELPRSRIFWRLKK